MKLKSLVLAMPLAFSSAAFAQVVDLEITNLTHGMHFTPIFINAHSAGTHVFEAGATASSAVQAMAEGGSIADLVSGAAAGSMTSENPAAGLLAPSVSADVMNFDTGSNTHLSLTAMLLPTNDGFVGLNAWEIPQTAGTYTVYLNAYDAGTEANDEIIVGMSGGPSGNAGIPAAPGGDAGTGATGVTSSETNAMVHIHRGNVGDTDSNGGISDVDSRIHRWLNPVAKLVVTVK
ncbi:spondin domain-containing protein [Pseudomonas sp. HK3]|jgi:hypothetical protein